MALNFFNRYTPRAVAPSANYPFGSFLNETVPGALDGSPCEKDWADDFLGFFQKLMDYTGLAPSGIPDTVVTSQYFNALQTIFTNFMFFFDGGTGTPDDIIVTSVGAPPVAYTGGMIVLFKASATNFGAVTLQIDTLAQKAVTQPDGTPLIGADIKADRYVLLRFNFTDDRFELVQLGADAIPVGTELIWPLATPPTGFLEEDGSAIDRLVYADLFAVLGTSYGVGDGINTFNLPDFRGEGLRGWDHGAGRDPDSATRTNRGDGTTGDNVGTKQGFAVESHVHQALQITGTNFNKGNNTPYISSSISGAYGGNETRMRNVYRMMIIKY